VLLGIVPETMELAVGLSPAVARALPALVEQVVSEAAQLGFAFTPGARRNGDETPGALGAHHVARLAGVR
jgi:hypothetical protein